MVAPALASFVVGIGYAMDSGSERAAQSSFDRMKKGLAGLSSAAAALSAVTISYANSDTERAAWGEMFGLSIRASDAWAGVFERSGSSEGSMRGLVEKLKKVKAAEEMGEGGYYKSFAVSGLSASDLAGDNAQQWLINIANRIAKLSANQRINAMEELGGDHRMLKVFAQGGGALAEAFRKELAQTSVTSGDVDRGNELLGTMHDMGQSMERLNRAMSRLMIGPLGKFIEGIGILAEFGADAVEGKGMAGQMRKELQNSPINPIGGSTSMMKFLIEQLIKKAKGGGDADQASTTIQMNLNGQAFGTAVIGEIEQFNQRQAIDIIPNIG